jgi:hypothetical protein
MPKAGDLERYLDDKMRGCAIVVASPGIIFLLAYDRARKTSMSPPLVLVGVSTISLIGGLVWLYFATPRDDEISFQKLAFFG